jgi:hypothetical protein
MIYLLSTPYYQAAGVLSTAGEYAGEYPIARIDAACRED